MPLEAIFGLQLTLSIVLFGLVGVWLVSPALRGRPLHEQLFWLMLPHATRHVGLVFLVPGVVSDGIPRGFANMAAYGDLAAGVLALIGLVLLRRRAAVAIGFAWLVNLVGAADLINALRHAEAIPHLQAAWFIPTMLVPLLLVTHAMMFTILARQLRHPELPHDAAPTG